jgi:hypothetical protein
MPEAGVPSILNDGVAPSLEATVVGAILAAVAVVWFIAHGALIVIREKREAVDDADGLLTVSVGSFSALDAERKESARSHEARSFLPLLSTVAAAFGSGRWRFVPIGVVVALFYAVSATLFWLTLLFSSDNDAPHAAPPIATSPIGPNASTVASSTMHNTQAFAQMLVDPTDPRIFTVYIVLAVFFTCTVIFSQFVLKYTQTPESGIAKTEAYRMGVTIFTPSCCIFFLDLARALIYRCSPIDAMPICVEPDSAARLLVLPVVTLTQSLCGFQLWIRLATFNRSLGLAALATILLVVYGLLVCVFNARVVATSPQGIEPGFFYIAMLKAILTEIWVFQFIRVGVENIVHCFHHSMNHLQNTVSSMPMLNASSADLSRQFSHGAASAGSHPAHDDDDTEDEDDDAPRQLLLPDDLQGVVSSMLHQQQQQHPGPHPADQRPAATVSPPSGPREQRAPSLQLSIPAPSSFAAPTRAVARAMAAVAVTTQGYHGLMEPFGPPVDTPLHSVATFSGTVRKRRKRASNAGEYIMLLTVFLVTEFAALVVVHDGTALPGVTDYDLPLVIFFDVTRTTLHLGILLYAAVRLGFYKVLKPVRFERYASAMVMNAFTWVLVVALSVVEAESELSHWPVLVVNLTRFVTFVALLLLRPRHGRVSRFAWLVVALTVFLWICLTVAVQLVSEGYEAHASTASVLRAVFTESLMFETLSLALDRYYNTPEDLPRIPADCPNWNARARRWCVLVTPLVCAVISIASRIVTFGGSFASTNGDTEGFMATRPTNTAVLLACGFQIAIVALLVALSRRCATRVRIVDGSSFIASGLFLVFSVICSFIFVLFAKPATIGNVLGVCLQPISDIALVAGPIALWSAVPMPRKSSLHARLGENQEEGRVGPTGTRWRQAGVVAQFVVAAVHCTLGVDSVPRATSLSGFELFHLLRWCCMAFALYEVFVYASLTAQAPDLPPPPSNKRPQHAQVAPFFVCGALLIVPPLIGSITRTYSEVPSVSATDFLNPQTDAVAFSVTALELICYLTAIVYYVRHVRANPRHTVTRSIAVDSSVDSSSCVSHLCILLGERYRVHTVGVLVAFAAYYVLDVYVSLLPHDELRPWATLLCVTDLLRGVLQLSYFLHFMPYGMQQVRKRALASSGMYLVCSTRLITYGLQVVHRDDVEHPVYITVVALFDTLVTLHVTALARAQFPRSTSAPPTAPRGRGGDGVSGERFRVMSLPAVESAAELVTTRHLQRSEEEPLLRPTLDEGSDASDPAIVLGSMQYDNPLQLQPLPPLSQAPSLSSATAPDRSTSEFPPDSGAGSTSQWPSSAAQGQHLALPPVSPDNRSSQQRSPTQADSPILHSASANRTTSHTPSTAGWMQTTADDNMNADAFLPPLPFQGSSATAQSSPSAAAAPNPGASLPPNPVAPDSAAGTRPPSPSGMSLPRNHVAVKEGPASVEVGWLSTVRRDAGSDPAI